MKAAVEYDVCSPEYYGFGVGIMKRIKVCPQCGASEAAEKNICGQCGAALPAQTLFQQYRRMHSLCPRCDTVLSDGMRFCPHCGMKLGLEKRGGPK